jgi:hypothetical protein
MSTHGEQGPLGHNWGCAAQLAKWVMLLTHIIAICEFSQLTWWCYLTLVSLALPHLQIFTFPGPMVAVLIVILFLIMEATYRLGFWSVVGERRLIYMSTVTSMIGLWSNGVSSWWVSALVFIKWPGLTSTSSVNTRWPRPCKASCRMVDWSINSLQELLPPDRQYGKSATLSSKYCLFLSSPPLTEFIILSSLLTTLYVVLQTWQHRVLRPRFSTFFLLFHLYRYIILLMMYVWNSSNMNLMLAQMSSNFKYISEHVNSKPHSIQV